MPATKVLPQFEAFGSYVDPFGAHQRALTLWLDAWKAGVEMTSWWTTRWFDTVSVFASVAPAAAPAAAPRPIAAIIDLAQAAAARTAVEVPEAAAQVVQIAETVAETAAVVVADAVSVVEHAAEIVAPEAVAPEAVTFEPDDLTRLVGIGPKLSVALAAQGVTRFADIARWTEADLLDVDKALDLKGRAVRDAWVAQAKRFASEI